MHQHALVIDPGWLIWNREAMLPEPDLDQYLVGESLLELLNAIENRKIKLFLPQELQELIFSEFPYEAGTRNPFKALASQFTIFLRKHDTLIVDAISHTTDVEADPPLQRGYFSEDVTVAVDRLVGSLHAEHQQTRLLSLVSHKRIWPVKDDNLDGASNIYRSIKSRNEKYYNSFYIVENNEIIKLLNTVKNVFEHNPKHRLTSYRLGGNLVSPLLTPHGRAEVLLQTAIGENRDIDEELFAYDADIERFIVFKVTHPGKPIYHAYNPEDDNEVPTAIQQQLR